MKKSLPALFTTSWDDGHPFDLRIAELLLKHGAQATFYIPRKSDKTTMTSAMVRELAEHFEIGAHTLNHVDLLRVQGEIKTEEIRGSKKWVEDITGKECRMFCPPKGRFDQGVVDIALEAGFQGIRTVELLSLHVPRFRHGLYFEPTSLQLFDHGGLAYMRNSLKRNEWGNVPNFWKHRYGKTLVEAAGSMVANVGRGGGCFHLWGHSWEIEQHGLWKELDRILALHAGAPQTMQTVTNSEACIQ